MYVPNPQLIPKFILPRDEDWERELALRTWTPTGLADSILDFLISKIAVSYPELELNVAIRASAYSTKSWYTYFIKEHPAPSKFVRFEEVHIHVDVGDERILQFLADAKDSFIGCKLYMKIRRLYTQMSGKVSE